MANPGWKDWYAPREIHFGRMAALWLIQNLGSLRSGHWPVEESSYVDIAKILKKGGYKAPFETPIEYAVEIMRRLERCGVDGLILLAIECWGESEISMAKYLKMPEWSIRKRARRALAYVASGPAARWHDTRKRKGQTYREFISQERKK